MIKKNARFTILEIEKTSSDFHNGETQLVEWDYTYGYVARGVLTYYDRKNRNEEVSVYVNATSLRLLTDIEYTTDDFNYNEKFKRLTVKSFEPVDKYWEFQLFAELYKEVPYEFTWDENSYFYSLFKIYDSNISYNNFAESKIIEDYLPMFSGLVQKYRYIGFDFLLNFFHYYAFKCIEVQDPAKLRKMQQGIDDRTYKIYLPGGKYNLNSFLQDPYFSSIVSLYSFQDLTEKISANYPLKSISLIHEVFLQSIKVNRKKTGRRYFSNKYSSYLTAKEVHEALNKTVKVSLQDTKKFLDVACNMGLLVHFDNKYFLSEVYNKEKYISNKMEKMYKPGVKNKIPNELIDKYSAPLSHGQEQRAAISKIAGNKAGIEVLIGGAGTGKTATAKTIVKFFEKLYNIPKDNMLFLAPTAKAKGVLANALNADAYTVKKALLSLNFENYDVILIDETGVLSLFEFYEILAKINSKQKLILLGDKYQLASIDYGTVLRDIEEKSDVIQVNELTEVFRQGEGNPIVDLSVAIREQRTKKENLDSKGSLLVDKIGNLELFIQDILDYNLNFFNNFENIQIITPANNFKDEPEYKSGKHFSLSTNYINKRIQAYRKSKEPTLASLKVGQNEFLIGDKVMHTKNESFAIPLENHKGIESTNNSLGIENSDLGKIIDIQNGYVYVKYENGKIIKYTTKGDTSSSCLSIFNLNIAYAITIMKSQGSEWNTVIFLVDDNIYSKTGLSLNMLYTAVTRPKVNLIIGYNFIQKITINGLFKEYGKKTAFKATRSHLFEDKD